MYTFIVGKGKDLIMNLANKNKGKTVKRKHSNELRKFALTLNFYSPKAYEFLRTEFNCVLPHTRTLSKWYSHIDPGFTQESLNILALKINFIKTYILCFNDR